MTKFQAPKGTRDFYPDDMAIRRHLDDTWRRVAINHGFDEVDGPTFEHLDLYTVKSGEEIVGQLFSFRRPGGDTDYALRPEFTPTLARMVAARGASLSLPVRWYAIPAMFRAERPQRGRLREHIQFNADIIGSESLTMDADLIAVAVGILEQLGLTPENVRIKFSHREAVRHILAHLGVDDEAMQSAFELLDRRDKMDEQAFDEKARALGLSADGVAQLNEIARAPVPLDDRGALVSRAGVPEPTFERLFELGDAIAAADLAAWCEYDLGIVRGLAYYTGTVFEVHASSGRERAVAGGGRYDKLVELLGGAPTPAVGFAMGDVVIRLVLEELGLLEAPHAYQPRPDLFVIVASDGAQSSLRSHVSRWRRAGLHVRHSARTTRNVGKLIGEANRNRARLAVILGDELADGMVDVKDLVSGDQRTVRLEDVPSLARAAG